MSPIARRTPLFPLMLLGASLCFAGQAKNVTAAAPNQNQASTKKTEAKADGNAVISHSLPRIRFHLGTVMIGAGYTHFSGPSILPLYYSYGYPYWGYNSYYPFWGYPYWGSAYYGFLPYPPFAIRGYDEGQVKLRIDPRTAEVLINNAYAGTAASLKGNIWLRPGVYELRVKAPGRAEFHRRIYVLSGKKLEIVARLAPVNGPKNGRKKP